jgi:hypothetical protein
MRWPWRKRSKPPERPTPDDREPEDPPPVPDGPDLGTRYSYFGWVISLLDRPPRRRGPPG